MSLCHPLYGTNLLGSIYNEEVNKLIIQSTSSGVTGVSTEFSMRPCSCLTFWNNLPL